MSNSFTQVFGGTTIYPADVSYLALTLDGNISLEWPLEATAGSSVVARIIDITPSGPYTITMPDAMSVSVGQTVLFNNLGPSTITVNKADGNAILSIAAGEQWQAYLINNTTPGGTWRTLRYGAATAQAQAAALAGPGLTTSGSALAQNYDVVDFSATPYSLTGPDRAKVLVWTGGLGTLNLPTAAAAGDGWFVQVRNSGQGDLTIDPSGSELINAGSTLRLQPGDSAVVVGDGVQWYTIGLGQQAVFAFDYTSVAVTGGTYTLSGSELNRIAYKFTGTLTSNSVIVVPATVQQYWVNNATTGPFTLGLRAAGSATVTNINQNATAILYCDGTDIVPATTSAPFAGILPITQGGTGASSAASARTNLGATGIGSTVFTAATTAAARTAIAAAASGANSDITSLTGLTTPLSVAQGGTGASVAATARTNLSAAASGANSDITSLNPASGLTVGTPTGGAQGLGTINAAGLFINGVGVGTGSGSVTSVAFSGGTTGLTATGSPITTSGTITLSGTLAVANGGTGNTTYTNGQLLIGNTTGNTLTKATLTAGSGISITNGAGSITIAATGGGGSVTSVAFSGGTTGLTVTGSPITTSGTITLGGALVIANGGTGATSASGARLNLGAATSGANSDITSITGLTTPLAFSQGGTGNTSYTDGQLLIGNTATGGLSKAAITAGSGITVTNGNGSITIASTAGGGSVTSVDVSGGTTGLTATGGPITGSGTITLGGTLAVANGGTGSTTASAARTALSVPSTTGTGASGTWGISITGNAATVTDGVVTTGTYSNPAWITALAGSKITGNITGNAANVTGTVAIANGGTGATTAALARTALDVPTRTGTDASGTWGISITGNAATATNGVVTTGSYADPAWITSLAGSKVSGNITGNAANVTGTVAVANGGTGQTTYTNGQLLIGNTTGNTLTKATLTAGSGISITNGSGSITIAATGASGTVTSIDGSGGTTGLTLSGGPITTSGTLSLGGTLVVANGGTGSTTASGARTALDVPSTTGSGASGTWGISITGSAANVPNGVVTTSSYSDPTWIASLSATKLTGTVAIVNGGTGSSSTTYCSLTSNVTGILPVANGGTGVSSSTGTGSVVLSTSPTLVTPTLGAASATSVTNALGSAAAPSYTFTGDTNTGIFSPAADTIAFAEGGVEAMRLDSAGNLGVGVTPSAWVSSWRAVDVISGGGALFSTLALSGIANNAFFDSGSNWRYKSSFGAATVSMASDGSVSINNAGAGTAGNVVTFNTRVYVSPTGDVGIGTSSPASRFHAAGITRISDATNSTAVAIDASTTAGLTSITAQFGGSQLALGSAATERMRIDASGNVGIGTTTPGVRLDVNGTVRATGLTVTTATATVDGISIGYRSIPRSTTTTTAVVGDVGKCIAVSAGITIPNATFAAGDAVSIYNDSASAVTITQGASLTLRQAGTTNTGNRTLAARGMATIWFNSSSEAVISGAGVT